MIVDASAWIDIDLAGITALFDLKRELSPAPLLSEQHNIVEEGEERLNVIMFSVVNVRGKCVVICTLLCLILMH